MKFWPLNPYYKRSYWKNLSSRKIFWSSTSKLWNKKIYILPKFTEMERNWIIFTPYRLKKSLWQIQSLKSHIEFTGKNKVGNTMCAKLHDLIGQNWQNSFQQTHMDNFLVSIRQAFTLDFSFLRILSCYFSEIYCTFCFRQMFNRFWRSNSNFHWGLALQFSCITVRLSEGSFLFAVASD